MITGLVCTGDIVLGRALAKLLQVSRFQVVGLVETAADAIADVSAVAAAGQATPDVIVLDLAASGLAGIRVLPRLLEPCPQAALVVVSPFPVLTLAIVEAGATLVVDPSDLRPMLGLLVEIRSEAHAGYPCPCCTPPPPGGSAAASSPPSSKVSRPEAMPGLLWDRPYGSTGGSAGPGMGSSGSEDRR